MKKLILFTTAILAANLLTAQINIVDDSFYSEVLQQEMMVDVYLPPGYDINPDLYYPVIYFLHGWGGNQNNLQFYAPTANTMIQNDEIEPFIMVCANNQAGPFGGTFYMNSPLWGDFETYNFTEVVDFIEENYRAIPDKNKRALMGQSMGASGCFEPGISKKDKFRAIAAHGYGGVFEACLDNWQSQIISEQTSGPPYFYEMATGGFMTKLAFLASGAYAPNFNSPQTWINPTIVEYVVDDQAEYIDTVLSKWLEHSGHQLIKNLIPGDDFGIFFGTGENDNLGFYPGCVALKDSMDAYGIPATFFSHNGGHSMPSSFMQEAYVFLDSIFKIVNTSINKYVNDFGVIVSPNPITQKARLNFNTKISKPVEVFIYDISGFCLVKQQFSDGDKEIVLNMDSYPSGIYFCRIHIGNEIVTKKIIKQ